MDCGVCELVTGIKDLVEGALDPVSQALASPLRAAPGGEEGPQLLEPAHLLKPPHVP